MTCPLPCPAVVLLAWVPPVLCVVGTPLLCPTPVEAPDPKPSGLLNAGHEDAADGGGAKTCPLWPAPPLMLVERELCAKELPVAVEPLVAFVFPAGPFVPAKLE